ncbi:hypothetical protein AMJ80_03885 [bacterium SM23_31]|nr:MAG: hypothetical protein AMJ80_03885 [bacterium SM23_31]
MNNHESPYACSIWFKSAVEQLSFIKRRFIRNVCSRLCNSSIILLVVISAVTFVYANLMNCAGSSAFKKGHEFYNQNQLDEALPFFRSAVEKEPQNADNHAWLAETLRRLNRKEEAVAEARRAILLDENNSFAHTVLADACNPQLGNWAEANLDTTWHHLLKAVECDPGDGNAWLGIWGESIRRGNSEMEKKALHSLINTGFLTPSLLAYNRWVLNNVPENAVLLTNGDMDTYPAVALQEVERLRQDVGIVNLSLLNLPWYARFIRDKYNISLPYSDTGLESLKLFRAGDGSIVTISKQIVSGWLNMQKSGDFPRPIAPALTVGDLDFSPDSKSQFIYAGPFWLYRPDNNISAEDTTMMRSCLESINPDDFSGSFVSLQDRSPVRRMGTDRIVTNITVLAVRYSAALMKSGRFSEAYKIADWAEKFERKTKAGPLHAEKIKELKKEAIEAEEKALELSPGNKSYLKRIEDIKKDIKK